MAKVVKTLVKMTKTNDRIKEKRKLMRKKKKTKQNANKKFSQS